MTVRKLIDRLEKLPAGAEVVCAFTDCDGDELAGEVVGVDGMTEAYLSQKYGLDFGGKDHDAVVVLRLK